MQLLRTLGLAACVIAAPTTPETQSAELIPNDFIVVMKKGVTESVIQSTIDSVTGLLGGTAPRIVHKIGSFRGFTVSVGDDSLLASIKDLVNVS